MDRSRIMDRIVAAERGVVNKRKKEKRENGERFVLGLTGDSSIRPHVLKAGC